MSAFEYVTVLISVVLSLGIAQILLGVAGMIKQFDRVTLYWPHLLWVLFVLLLHIQEWWVTYELKNFTPWRLPSFLFIMIYPINLFVLAKLLFPERFHIKPVNLKNFYFKNYRKIFTLLVFSGLLSILYNLFILSLPVREQVLQLLLIIVISGVAIRKYTPEWVHRLLSVIVMLSMVGSIIIEWNVWLIE